MILKFNSSDEEDMIEEEKEVIRLRAEQTRHITTADAGLDDDDDDTEEESDRELTMEVGHLCYQLPSRRWTLSCCLDN